jgi:hypothetical protein
MADLAAQYRELYADLELSPLEPRAEDRPLSNRVDLLSRLQRFSPQLTARPTASGSRITSIPQRKNYGFQSRWGLT